MANIGSKLSRQWHDAVNVLLGLWLVISPWLFGYTAESVAAWNAWIPGVIVAVAAIAALTAFQEWEEWVNALLGVWLVVSPWITGYAAVAAATWNHVVVGVLTAALAIWAAWQARQQPAEAH